MYRYFFLPMLVLLFAAGPVLAAGEKLLLVGSGEPDPKDVLLVDFLEEWGYEIELREHWRSTRAISRASISSLSRNQRRVRIFLMLTKTQPSQSSTRSHGLTTIWVSPQTGRSTPMQAMI